MNITPLLTVEEGALKTIAESINETEKSLKQNVEIIKKWFETQPHFPKMGDNKIQNFLILNKGSIEKTKQKISLYYAVRSNMKNFYGDINPKLPHMKNLLDAIYLSLNPKLTKEMDILYVIKLRDLIFLDDVELKDAFGHIFNIYELITEFYVSSLDIIIFDCTGLTQCLRKATPTIMQKAATAYKVFSTRLKSAYCINVPPIGFIFFEIVKKIIKPKIFQRIHFLKDQDELKKYLSEDMIPEDFGGKGPSLEHLQNLLKTALSEHQNFFDELDELKVDESLRPEKLTNDEVLGYYGNFKKLDVD